MTLPAARASKSSSRRAKSSPKAARAPVDAHSIWKLSAERIIQLSEADETEVEIHSASDALTRFANNTIHQNVAEQTLEHFCSRRRRRAAPRAPRRTRRTMNRLRARGRRRSAACAQSAQKSRPAADARAAEISKSFAVLSGDCRRNAAEPRARSRESVPAGRKAKQTAAGIFSSGSTQSVLVNSKGLFARYEQTRAEFSVSRFSRKIPRAGPSPLRSTFARSIPKRSPKAPAGKRPARAIRANSSPAITPRFSNRLPCSTSSDFFSTISPAPPCSTSAPASPGRLGKKLFGDNITLWDDVYHPLQLGAALRWRGRSATKVLLDRSQGFRKILFTLAPPQKK